MRVGGRVEWLLEPATPDELCKAYEAARETDGPVRILGGGANLVIDDGVLPGIVISTTRLRRIFRPSSSDEGDDITGLVPSSRVAPANPADDPRLVVWCGATLPSVVRAARDLGYAGLEGIVGVPGNVGGGVAMNAGGKWGDMWDVVETVRVLTPEGELVDRERADCNPRYRNGGLGDDIVTAAVLRFTPEPKPMIEARMREYLTEKRTVQPVTEWSAGCVFKNPDPEISDGRSAGRLVDEVGGKDRSRGDAIVSPRHANFIVNRGGATATDVFTLMEDIQDLVAQKTGIRLEFEVKRWRP